MKKVTLLLSFLIASLALAQTNSTGLVTLSNSPGLVYQAQIDVTSTEVILTLIGPSDRWLGMGFDAQSMTAGQDVVIFDGTNLTDRTFQGIGVIPALDANQDWTIQSNNVNSGVRTIIGTRPISTPDASDYDFNLTDTSLNVVWARGDGTFTLGYHGATNKGPTTIGFTLGVNDFSKQEFSIYPNPSSNTFTLELPTQQEGLLMEVYDVLGKKIVSKKLDGFNTNPVINVTSWNKGVYLVKLSSEHAVQTKKFIKQ